MTPEELKRLQLYDRIARGMGNVGAKMLAVGNPWMSVPRGPAAPGLADDAVRRMELEKLNRQQTEQQRRQTATSKLFGGRDPRTGITWNQGRPEQLQQIAGDPSAPFESRRASMMGLSQVPSLLARANPEKAVEAMIAQQFPRPTAPKDPAVREFKEGDKYVTKQLNRTTGQWEKVGEAPRYKPPETNINVEPADLGGLSTLMTKSQRGKEIAALRENRVQAVQMVKQGSALVSNLREAGDQAVSWSGAMSRGINTLASQGGAIAKNFGIRMGDGSISKRLDEGDWQWGELASTSSVVRSRILGLAVAVTKADQGSRPSDFDVQTSISRLAGSSGSASVMADTVEALLREKMGDFDVRYNTLAPDYDLPAFDWKTELAKHKIDMPGGDSDPLGIR